MTTTVRTSTPAFVRILRVLRAAGYARHPSRLTARLVRLAFLRGIRSGPPRGEESRADVIWLVYWPVLLVVAAAVAAVVAILVRKLRRKDDNPFIVNR